MNIPLLVFAIDITLAIIGGIIVIVAELGDADDESWPMRIGHSLMILPTLLSLIGALVYALYEVFRMAITGE